MMEAPGGRRWWRRASAEALDFRRAMRKVEKEYGRDWWFKVWGPDKLADEGIGRADDWVLQGRGPTTSGTASATWPKASTCSTRSSARSSRPGLDMSGKFAKTGIPAAIVTKFLAEHGIVVEKTGPVLVLHHVHHRHHQGPLEHAADRAAAVQGRLRQERADVAHPARVLRRAPALRAHGAARPVPARPRDVCQGRHRAPDDRDVPVDCSRR